MTEQMEFDPATVVRNRIEPSPERALDWGNAARQTTATGFPSRTIEELKTTPKNYTAPPEWMEIRETLLDGGTVLIWGNRGTGKTMTAAAIGYNWHLRGYIAHGSARYWRLASLLGEQKDWFGAASPKPTGPLTIAADCGLLVVDEVDEMVGSDFDMSELVRLVDTRYSDMKPTVLISNRPPDELARVVGFSVIDRIRGCSGFVEMVGGSRRGHA